MYSGDPSSVQMKMVSMLIRKQIMTQENAIKCVHILLTVVSNIK